MAGMQVLQQYPLTWIASRCNLKTRFSKHENPVTGLIRHIWKSRFRTEDVSLTWLQGNPSKPSGLLHHHAAAHRAQHTIAQRVSGSKSMTSEKWLCSVGEKDPIQRSPEIKLKWIDLPYFAKTGPKPFQMFWIISFCTIFAHLLGAPKHGVKRSVFRFTIVPPQPQNTFGHVLYLIHRASLLGPPKAGHDAGSGVLL